MTGDMSLIVGAMMILTPALLAGFAIAQSPGYALRDPAATGVPASPEPDITIPSGHTIDRALFVGGELITPSALMSVTWINESAMDNQTCISIIGKGTRYIGASKVYDQNGCLTSRSKPIMVTTYFRQRFSAIYEFNDTNGDGVANVVRNGQPIEAGRVMAREPVYKAVDLRVGWKRTDTASGTVMENGHEVKTFDFTLTATNLSYIVIGDPNKVNRSAGDGKLNEVSFTFHMKGWFEPAELSVPVFNITVDRSGALPKANATKTGMEEFEDHTMKVKSKEDHTITGWDYDPQNTDPGIVLETDFTYGSFVPVDAPDWLTGGLMEGQLGGSGSIAYKADGSGSETLVDGDDDSLLDAEGPLDQSDVMMKLGSQSRIGFRDNWQEAGWFSWPDATRVWHSESTGPMDGTSAFQVQGARRFTMDLKDQVDERLVGVFLLGGFSYTGGPFYRIRHDPENKMDYSFISIPDRDNAPPIARAEIPKGEFSYTQSVTLDASGSTDPDQDPLTYIWWEGPAIVGRGPVLTRDFPLGRHNVTLTVDDDGSRNSTMVSFNIVNKPTTAAIAKLTKTVYSRDEEIMLDGSGSIDPENGTLSYEWKEGNTSLGAGPILLNRFPEGDHNVILVVTDERGAVSWTSANFTVEREVQGYDAMRMAALVGIPIAFILVAAFGIVVVIIFIKKKNTGRRAEGPRSD